MNPNTYEITKVCGNMSPFECKSCGWKPKPGGTIICEDVLYGPWYCPICNDVISPKKKDKNEQ